MKNKLFLPLRKAHGKIYEWRLKLKKRFKFWCYITFPLGKKIYIVCTPTHSNIGDSAIVLAEVDFIQRLGFPLKRIKELTTAECSKKEFKIHKSHLMIYHGGGNLGNQWLGEELLRRRFIQRYPYNPSIIFPQTIFYTPDEEGKIEQLKSISIYNSKNKLTITTRETTSYKIALSLYSNASILLTPDIVLSMEFDAHNYKHILRNNVMLCMRADCEKAICDNDLLKITSYLTHNDITYSITDMHASSIVNKDNRKEIVDEKFKEFSASKLVITDRLHGMIFAAFTGTPCITLSNYNHKVKGTYEWISYLPYIRFADNINEAIDLIPEMFKIQDSVFDNTPLIPYFDRLAEVIREYAAN